MEDRYNLSIAKEENRVKGKRQAAKQNKNQTQIGGLYQENDAKFRLLGDSMQKY